MAALPLRRSASVIAAKEGEPPVTINEEAERFALIGIVVGIARDLVGGR